MKKKSTTKTLGEKIFVTVSKKGGSSPSLCEDIGNRKHYVDRASNKKREQSASLTLKKAGSTRKASQFWGGGGRQKAVRGNHSMTTTNRNRIGSPVAMPSNGEDKNQ